MGERVFTVEDVARVLECHPDEDKPEHRDILRALIERSEIASKLLREARETKAPGRTARRFWR